MVNFGNGYGASSRGAKFLILLVVLSASLLRAQSVTVREIARLDRLPVSSVHRIFQDSEGYMWYGTVDGLCRDDGYNVHVFRSDFNHPGAMQTNLVQCIAEDRQRRIWIGTPKGMYRLDKAGYRISPVDIPELAGRAIQSVFATCDGQMWTGTDDGAFSIAAGGDKAQRCIVEGVENPGRLNMLYEDAQRNVFACFACKGLYRLNPETHHFEPLDDFDEKVDASDMVHDGKYYWITTWHNGILRLDLNATSKAGRYVYQPLPVNVAGQASALFFHLVRDDVYGYLWATGFDDLYLFRVTPQGMLEQMPTTGFLPRCNKMLYEIIKDRDGNLWVSGFDTHSFIVNLRDNGMEAYPVTVLRERIKGKPVVVALCRDEEGQFWFSQERTGLCTYNPQNDKLTTFADCPGVKDLPLHVVPYLVKSSVRGKVWAIAGGGSRVYGLCGNGAGMRLENLLDLATVAADPGVVETIYEDRAGNLWIGTLSGIYLYRNATGKLEIVAERIGNISGFVQTADGAVWATVRNKGICRIGADAVVRMYPSNNDFLCIDCTSDGKLWAGTGEGGVWCLDPAAAARWTDCSAACGMNGDMVDNIAVDPYNHVWVVTNQRITEFNPGNGALWSLGASGPDNLLERFMPRAVYKHRDGRLYFGGFGGIVSLLPSQRLEGIPLPVKAHVTNVEAMGRSLFFDGNADGPVEILPGQQNLKIEFSTLDYPNAPQIRYAYRLVGVDNNWVFLPPGRNSAFYNRLGKGRYRFEVKATDKNGLWGNEVTAIDICRLPAPYETWWAYLLYLLLGAAALGYALSVYLKRERRLADEKWSDSAELVKMRRYLDHDGLTLPDHAQIDKLLMDRVTKVVEAGLADPAFNVVTLARAVNMSRSTLSRKIKMITGKTPLDFIKEVKMLHARRLLENKTASVADVMVALGYSDPKNFAQSFKEAFGMNPSEYQKQAKGLGS